MRRLKKKAYYIDRKFIPAFNLRIKNKLKSNEKQKFLFSKGIMRLFLSILKYQRQFYEEARENFESRSQR